MTPVRGIFKRSFEEQGGIMSSNVASNPGTLTASASATLPIGADAAFGIITLMSLLLLRRKHPQEAARAANTGPTGGAF